MTGPAPTGTFALGDRIVKRVGYGTMQLAGPRMSGPPADRDAALSLLRAAAAAGVDHFDTADFYGPHVTNELLREALAPYPDDITIVTKVGVTRHADGSFNINQTPASLTGEVHDNLRTLGVDVLDVVNLRVIIGGDGMSVMEGSIAERFNALVDLQRQGLIRHLGLSNVTPTQVKEAQAIAPIVCVQNQYNIVDRADDALIDILAAQNIAYVPYFPLGGFSLVQSEVLSSIAAELGLTPLKVAQAWLLARSPNILLISGTSKIAHLHENLTVADIELPPEVIARLDGLVTQA